METDMGKGKKHLEDEPNLFARFQPDVEAAGLIGERENALVVLLSAVSARGQAPINTTVGGQSASGKNYLMQRVASFIPREHKKFLTGMSPKALMHEAEDAYEHRAVFIAEYEGVASADFSIRTLQSEHVIEWSFTDSSQDGLRTRTNTLKGPAAFIQATTRALLHPENETRQLFIHLDESEEATRTIIERQAQEAMYGESESPSRIQEPWQEFLLSLEAKPVVVQYADQLAKTFPASRVRTRRDFPKLLEMIKTCAYLHQKQRDQADDLIVASAQDYYLTKPLFEHCYRFGPDFHTTTLLRAATNLASEFTAADLQAKLRWGKTKTYEVLQRCSETGYVLDGKTRGRYRLVRTTKPTDLNLPNVLE
jgi:hypothetical protein